MEARKCSPSCQSRLCETWVPEDQSLISPTLSQQTHYYSIDGNADDTMPPSAAPQEAFFAIQHLLDQSMFAQAETLTRQLMEHFPADLNLLAQLDQAMHGLEKPQTELDQLKTVIVHTWETSHRSHWEAEGRPKKLSSWTRARGFSTNYRVFASEYYTPEDIGGIIAYFKVLAFPKSTEGGHPRVFKVETSAAMRELAPSRPCVLREYFFNGGGGSTEYLYSDQQLGIRKIMEDAIIFLNSNEGHVATTFPAVSRES